MLLRHVLRNSLLPTITVIATQTGYLIGGLVVVETLFNYQGIGGLIYKAAQAKDFPMLEGGVLTVGVVYAVATLAADLLLIALSPRLRAARHRPRRGRRRMTTSQPRPRAPSQRRQRRADPDAPPRWRLLPASRPSSSARPSCCSGWSARSPGRSIAPDSPLAQSLLATNAAPSAAHWFGTDQLGRDVLSRVLVGSRDILVITPLATVLGTVCGTALGLAMGYFGGVLDLLASRIVEAVLALPSVMVAFLFIVALGPSEVTLIIVIGFIFTPLIARTVRAAVLAERHLDYLPAARLLGAGAWSVMVMEILPNVLPAVLVEFSVRLGYAVFTVATLSFLGFGIQPPTPDWGSTSPPTTGSWPRATGGRRCSPRSPSPRWSSRST